MMSAVSSVQPRTAPLRRVRLYTVTSLALGVVLVTGWTVRQLVGEQLHPIGLLLSALVLTTGAAAAFGVWWRTRSKPLPNSWVWAGLSLAVTTIMVHAYTLSIAEAQISASPDLVLAFIALVVLALSAVRSAVWTLGFTAVAGSISLAALDVNPLTLVTVAGISWAAGASSTWIYSMVQELETSRQDLAALQVAEERLRFSRDVHDVVGRALAAISVKSQLAAALAQKQDSRATSEMQAVSAIAHKAMAETRDIAAGYREVDLDRELQGARALLSDAGAEVSIPENTYVVAENVRDSMALVVREAVTNILRHSEAKKVIIYLGPDHIMITNDGVRPGRGSRADASGLNSLRQRIENHGGILETSQQRQQFCLTAHLGKGAS